MLSLETLTALQISCIRVQYDLSKARCYSETGHSLLLRVPELDTSRAPVDVVSKAERRAYLPPNFQSKKGESI